jgi:NADH-quinone oxidoreductase subunit J
MTATTITFYALASIILIFALLVVTARNTVYSILFLVVDFLAVALLYAAMNSMFVAAIQVLVYAGGIVVLYLFVVMLVNLKRPPEEHQDPNRHGHLGGLMAAAVLGELAVIAVYNVVTPPTPPESGVPQVGLIEPVAMSLYTDYLIPFEVASMLLLVAMVGAIILARREL